MIYREEALTVQGKRPWFWDDLTIQPNTRLAKDFLELLEGRGEPLVNLSTESRKVTKSKLAILLEPSLHACQTTASIFFFLDR